MPRKIQPPLDPPPNINSARIADEKIFKISPVNDFDLFKDNLESQIIDPQKSDSHLDIWRNFVLALVIYSNYCSNTSFLDICQLTVKDVIPALSQPYIYAPRINTTIPFAAPPLVKLTGIRLLASVSNLSDQKRLPLHRPPANTYLLTNSLDPPIEEDITNWWSHLDQWLAHISLALELTIPFTQSVLIAHVQNKAMKEHSAYVAGYLTGAHVPTLPMMVDSLTLLDDYRREFSLLPPSEPEEKHPQQPTNKAKVTKITETKNEELEKEIKTLLNITHPYRHAEKREKKLAKIRTKVTQKLEKITKEFDFETPSNNILEYNFKCAASWLTERCNKKPNTIRSDQSNLNTFLRHFDNQLITEITYEEILAFLDGFDSTDTRKRNVSTINQFHKHLTKKLKLEVSFPPINEKSDAEYRFVDLLSQSDIEHIIQRVRSYGLAGYLTAVSDILGAFGGMRSEETFAPNLGGINFELNQIAIYIPDPKHRTHRWVYMADIPKSVYSFLKKFHTQRLLEEKGNLTAKFLDAPDIDITPQIIHKINMEVFECLGIKGSHRDFRRFWVNRLLARSWSLVDIGKMAGHRSLETSVSNYSAIAPLLHIEEIKIHDPQMRLGRLGIVLKLSNRAIRKKHAKEKQIKLQIKKDSKKKIFILQVSEAVYLIHERFR